MKVPIDLKDETSLRIFLTQLTNSVGDVNILIENTTQKEANKLLDGWISKSNTGSDLSSFIKSEIKDFDDKIAELIYEVETNVGDNYIVLVNLDSSVKDIENDLTNNYATVTVIAATYATSDTVGALYTLKVTANGSISGFKAITNGFESVFLIMADYFKVTGSDEADALTVFGVDTIANKAFFTANVMIDGNLLISESIWAGGVINGGSGYFNQPESYSGYNAAVTGIASEYGIYGEATHVSNGIGIGGKGVSAGVVGLLTSGSGIAAVYGAGNFLYDSGTGIYGSSTTGKGVVGISISGAGVRGEASSSYGGDFESSVWYGCRGISDTTYGGWFGSTSGIGIKGNTGGTYGVTTDQAMFATDGFLSFTGSHHVLAQEDYLIGDILIAKDALGISVNQSYPYSETCIVAKDKRVIGICCTANQPLESLMEVLDSFTEDITETVEVKTDILDKKGKPTGNKETLTVEKPLRKTNKKGQDFLDSLSGYKLGTVNSLGEGMMNVCDEGGDIEPGDYICSSNVRGKGMKQDDDLLHNYTVAKALELVVWADEASNIKMIACTYHCG